MLGLHPQACTPEVNIQSNTIPTQTKNNIESKTTTLQPQQPRSKVVENSGKEQPKTLSKPPKTVINTPETSINNDDLDLDQIWQLVLGKLVPFVSALIKQYGHLISYKGTVATVGMKNKELLKLAQDKVPQIESAFQEVVGHKVKVNLQVRTASKIANKSHNPPSTTPTFPSPNNHNNPVKDKKKIDDDNKVNLDKKPTINLENNNNGQKQVIESANITEAQSNENSFDDVDFSDNKIQEVAEQFAKVFKGEIIADHEDLIHEEENFKNHKSAAKDDIELSNQTLEELTIEEEIDNNVNSDNPQDKTEETSINAQKIIGRPKITKKEEELEF